MAFPFISFLEVWFSSVDGVSVHLVSICLFRRRSVTAGGTANQFAAVHQGFLITNTSGPSVSGVGAGGCQQVHGDVKCFQSAFHRTDFHGKRHSVRMLRFNLSGSAFASGFFRDPD